MPEIALSVTTYQKPSHLRRVLESIAVQRGLDGKFELVVTDDGSTDETPEIVEQFSRRVSFPVKFTTHDHQGFHPARCRNEGAATTTASYLLFLDGDCVLPPDHVALHLEHRRRGHAMLGDCYRLEQDVSDLLTQDAVRRGEFMRWDVGSERRRLARQHRKMRLYSLLRHPTKPKLVSNNVGVWRRDFEQVNGFDENFRGWGQEDDDLGRRLKRAGVKLTSILNHTRSYHIWHPRDPSAPRTWREGPNVPYFLRRGRLSRCRNGLVKRSLSDIAIHVVGCPQQTAGVERMLAALGNPPLANGKPAEVEVLVLPGEGTFSGRAECQMLVALADSHRAAKLAAKAHIVVADGALSGDGLQFKLADFEKALAAIT